MAFVLCPMLLPEYLINSRRVELITGYSVLSSLIGTLALTDGRASVWRRRRMCASDGVTNQSIVRDSSTALIDIPQKHFGVANQFGQGYGRGWCCGCYGIVFIFSFVGRSSSILLFPLNGLLRVLGPLFSFVAQSLERESPFHDFYWVFVDDRD